MSDLDQLKQSLLGQVADASDEAAIEAVRVGALGKKGSISELLKTLGTMTPEERQTRGAAINALKTEVTEAIAARKTALRDAAIEARLAAETVDVSLPVRSSPAERGRIHPISQIVDEITAIFADMGFSIAEGPDIETDYYNFTALNFPEGHPAREMHDTFFFPADETGERKVLRTHTSPVQIRTMEAQKPPIRIIIPGKTYRQDSDATHSPMFHQVEGLVVDRTANVANMRWVLEEFCKAFFEVDSVTMRFRPSFFPFTEPSFEVDIQCDRSSGPMEDYPLAEKRARIVTYTADSLTYSPDPPTYYGTIDFEGGGRLVAEFAEATAEEVEVGRAVRMVFRIKGVDDQRGFTKYFWKAVPAGQGDR